MRLIAVTAALLAAGMALSQDQLAKSFLNPPDSAKPHTWWHWMDGNITKEGLTADLEAMKKAGIGGAQMFTVAVGIPPGPVGYMSDKWREMVKHAVKEAGRLGIELCIHNCAGWSSSGGPWIDPAHAMQLIAWSEKAVHGPMHFDDKLAMPKPPYSYKVIDYHKDIVVLAFPTPKPFKVEGLNGRSGASRGPDNLYPDVTPVPDGVAISREKILVISEKMDESGRLVWDVPDGDWTILRIGYTPTGKDNHPAPPEGDGLEVDKLSREALDVHWNGMMAKIIADLGPLAGKVLNNSLIDSYEVDSQNWTPKMREEFQQRRGYDLLTYLPVVCGKIVDSHEMSERFLWDLRRTIGDLFADNYYAYFRDLCHKAGLKFSTEPYGNGTFDNAQCGGIADIPMGEFWVGGGAIETTKLASSIGHVYGHPVIGAESFTADDNVGRYLVEPYGIKALGDKIFCNGINRYIFHRYAHQPWMNLKPGMTMGPWGMHLDRTETWWDDASAWLKYVARCQYLLQQGHFVADALYFYGEGAPNDLPYGDALLPAMPKGYDYDGCDATIVMNRITVKNGRIVLPDGTSYSILILPDSQFMTPRMARRVRDLVRQGAVVYGPKPTMSPSLNGYPTCDDEVAKIGDEVWGKFNGKTVLIGSYGSGRVIWGKSLNEVLTDLGDDPDLQYQGLNGGANLAHIHRNIDGADVYFVANQQNRAVRVDCSFRVAGKAPELWFPETGRTMPAPIYRPDKYRTSVTMNLGPVESVFVIFRKGDSADHYPNLTFVPQGQESETPQTIVIKSARYGTEDGRGVDVTAKVQQMVSEGQYEIHATNGMFGDPVVNVQKRLVVQYELNGKPMDKTVPENGTIAILVTNDNPYTFPEFDLIRDSKGMVAALPWKAGTFEWTPLVAAQKKIPVANDADAVNIAGPWTVNFAKGWGAPPTVHFADLHSWPMDTDDGVKYFSGTATYIKQFSVPAAMIGQGRSVWLDLGKVKNFARVRVNGKDLGILWKPPFRVEVTGIVKAGSNNLEIAITNLWPNRLIGDEQLPPDVEWAGARLKEWPDWLKNGKPRPKTGRLAFTTWHFYNKDSPLLESGLIGPVALRSARVLSLNP